MECGHFVEKGEDHSWCCGGCMWWREMTEDKYSWVKTESCFDFKGELGNRVDYSEGLFIGIFGGEFYL